MGFPKLVVLVLVFAAVWCFVRWLNQPRRDLPRRRAAPRRAIEAEELKACRVCGAYVLPIGAVDGSAGCGRPDCARPR